MKSPAVVGRVSLFTVKRGLAMIKQQEYTEYELLQIIKDKDLVIEALIANYENYIAELKAGREVERKFRQEQYSNLLKGTREKASTLSYAINKETKQMIKVVFIEDTGRKVYIGDKKVYDKWCPPTFKELTEIFKAHGVNENIENLYQYIVNCGIYQGGLEVSSSYEGGCID